jgi:crossover junction endodeoxyribonuclease RusA
MKKTKEKIMVRVENDFNGPVEVSLDSILALRDEKRSGYAKVTLLGEPKSTQHCYGLNCRGAFPTRYMTAKGKALKTDYQWQIKSQYREKALKGKIGMEVRLYFGTKRKSDIDNFNKILLDSLSGLVYEDDSQIEWMRTEKHYDPKKPRIELEIFSKLK